jgi:hypothetical protein
LETKNWANTCMPENRSEERNILHREKRWNLFREPRLFRTVKSNKLQCFEHATWMRQEMRTEFCYESFLEGCHLKDPEGDKKYNIYLNFRERRCDDMRWIELNQFKSETVFWYWRCWTFMPCYRQVSEFW